MRVSSGGSFRGGAGGVVAVGLTEMGRGGVCCALKG